MEEPGPIIISLIREITDSLRLEIINELLTLPISARRDIFLRNGEIILQRISSDSNIQNNLRNGEISRQTISTQYGLANIEIYPPRISYDPFEISSIFYRHSSIYDFPYYNHPNSPKYSPVKKYLKINKERDTCSICLMNEKEIGENLNIFWHNYISENGKEEVCSFNVCDDCKKEFEVNENYKCIICKKNRVEYFWKDEKKKEILNLDIKILESEKILKKEKIKYVMNEFSRLDIKCNEKEIKKLFKFKRERNELDELKKKKTKISYPRKKEIYFPKKTYFPKKKYTKHLM